MKNYYELLGVSITATSGEISRAMKRAAEQQRLDLETLTACRDNLLNAEARQAYNRELFMACPELLEEVARAAAEKVEQEKPVAPVQAMESAQSVQPNSTHSVNPPIKMGWVGKIGLSILAIFFMMAVLGGKAKNTAQLDEWSAQVACEDAVKTLLKAPATAEFDNWQRQKNADGTYKVTGTVDSQNSFGAMLRSQFGCTVRDKGDGRTGTMVDYLN